jgi:hypothetical protein
MLLVSARGEINSIVGRGIVSTGGKRVHIAAALRAMKKSAN